MQVVTPSTQMQRIADTVIGICGLQPGSLYDEDNACFFHIYEEVMWQVLQLVPDEATLRRGCFITKSDDITLAEIEVVQMAKHKFKSLDCELTKQQPFMRERAAAGLIARIMRKLRFQV